MPGAGLDETNAFVAVLEHKSFNRAAKQLGLSAPRVSELIRKFEERLGVRLVERTTRSVAPTVAGEQLLERLRTVLDDYEAALESINDFRSKPAGTLRLTVARRRRFRARARHPALPVRLSGDQSRHLHRQRLDRHRRRALRRRHPLG